MRLKHLNTSQPSQNPFEDNSVLKTVLRTLGRIYLYFFGRKLFFKFHEFLMTLGLHGMGFLNDYSFKASGERNFILNTFSYQENITVIDVGARLGHYANMVKKIVPSAKVLSLEPNPKAFQKLLEKNTHDNHTILNIAASSTQGSAKLFDLNNMSNGSAYASMHSILFDTHEDTDVDEIPIETNTIDDLINHYDLRNVDLLKIDAEGHELEVIKGAQKSISKGCIQRIQFEFEEVNALLGIFISDFKNLLPDFTFYRILPDGSLWPLSDVPIYKKEIFAYQNILAVRKTS